VELSAHSNPLEEFRRRGLPFLEGIHAAVRQQVSLAVPDIEGSTVLDVERLDRHGNETFGYIAGRELAGAGAYEDDGTVPLEPADPERLKASA
jgi:hypothetical protein